MATNDPQPDGREHAPFSPMRQARAATPSQRHLPDVGSLLGYTVSAVMAVVGVLVVAGFLVHQGVPEQFRWTFGVVLILMGLYRFFITQTRRRQKDLEREEEE